MMRNPQSMQSLAETLKRCGLVSSATEAERMAKSIAMTEQKVTNDFDRKKNEVEGELTRKRYASHQEEVNDIIERTRFDKKDYYIPIKGYTRETQAEVPKAAPTEETVQVQAPTPAVEEVRIPVRPVPAQEPVKVDAPQVPAITGQECVKPVHTDVVEDERTLNEIMEEDAKRIYTTDAPRDSREKEVDNALGADAQASAPRDTLSSASPSMEIRQPPVAEVKPPVHEIEVHDVPVAPPRPPVQAPPAKKEYKNPIDNVDLMKHFNFAAR